MAQTIKTSAHCPRCMGEHITISGKSIDLLFGLGMSIIGLGLLVPALSQSVSCYCFAFTLGTTGIIGTYKGIKNNLSTGYCSDCKHKFEYLLE